MTYDDVLATIRDEIQAEHTLLSHRLSWFVGAQSFILTAYSIAWNQHHEWRFFFQQAMPILGVVLSILASRGIWGALAVQKNLIRQQKNLLDFLDNPPPGTPDDKEREIRAEYRKTTCLGRPGGVRFHQWAVTAPWVIPVLFLVVWIFAYVGKTLW